MVKMRRSSAPAPRAFRLFVAVVAALSASLPAAAQSVEREMFVSVLNQADEPVLTLGAPDFIVREDGRTREVLRARRATDAIDLVLLVDTSQALGDQVNDVRKALEGFIARMRPQAQIAIVGVGDRPTIYSDYTNSPEQLARGVGRIFPIVGAGAYFLDAVAEVVKGLSTRKADRAAIVAIWAGGVEFGTESYENLAKGLKARGVSFHAIAIGNRAPRDSGTTEGRNRERLFASGTTETGGRRENPLNSMALAGALDRLASELLGQYRITFARPDTLIPPEKTEVAVRPDGLKARGILIAAPKTAK